MFAFLAMAGDLGGSIGPALVGYVAQQAGENIKAGMLAGCVFPVILIIAILLIMKLTPGSGVTIGDRARDPRV